MDHPPITKSLDLDNCFQVEVLDNSSKLQLQNPNSQEYFSIFFIERGSGVSIIDYKRYELSDQEVHFISPGQIHKLDLNNDVAGKEIRFSSDFLIYNNFPKRFISQFKFFKSYGEKPPLKLCQNSFNKLKNIIDQFEHFNDFKREHELIALGSLLKLFLIECNRSLFSNMKSDVMISYSNNIFKHFTELVDNHYTEWHKVKEYADQINVSSKHLSSTVKNKTGKLAKEFIHNRILSESKKLLLHSDLSIKEIAYQVGFSEPLHFSAFFKRKSGNSPTFYRKLNHNKHLNLEFSLQTEASKIA